MTKAEKRVIDAAMRDYRRLVRLKWDRTCFGGTPRKLWDACAALAAARVKRRKVTP